MLCTSGFVDDATFSYVGVNGLESSTLCLKVRQVAVPVGCQGNYNVWLSSSEYGTGGGVCFYGLLVSHTSIGCFQYHTRQTNSCSESAAGCWLPWQHCRKHSDVHPGRWCCRCYGQRARRHYSMMQRRRQCSVNSQHRYMANIVWFIAWN